MGCGECSSRPRYDEGLEVVDVSATGPFVSTDAYHPCTNDRQAAPIAFHDALGLKIRQSRSLPSTATRTRSPAFHLGTLPLRNP